MIDKNKYDGHTPGPLIPRETGDADVYHVCAVEGRWILTFRQNGELHTHEQLANMRLFADSPLLLKGFLAAQAYREAERKLEAHLACVTLDSEIIKAQNAVREARAALDAAIEAVRG